MIAATESLKRKMVRIGTHSGTFHCDEALGCYMLRHTASFKARDRGRELHSCWCHIHMHQCHIIGTMQDAEIVRSRDPEVLKVCL